MFLFIQFGLKEKLTNIIGGAAGALPPVIGWSIATGGVSIGQ